MIIEKQLLTVEETAEILGISPRTIYNHTHRKARNPFPIKPKRFGRLVKFRREDVEKYLKS